MPIKFDEDGKMIMSDPDVKACPTDPDELTHCEGCE